MTSQIDKLMIDPKQLEAELKTIENNIKNLNGVGAVIKASALKEETIVELIKLKTGMPKTEIKRVLMALQTMTKDHLK